MFITNKGNFRPYHRDKLTKYFPCHSDGKGGVTEECYNLYLTMQATMPFKIKVMSGYRSEAHNKAVGGAKNSAHLRGKALDLWAENDNERFLLVKRAIEIGVVRLGIYKSHVHIDIDGTLPQNVMWDSTAP